MNEIQQIHEKGVVESLRSDKFSAQPIQIAGVNKNGISFSNASPVNPQISFIGSTASNPVYHDIDLLESTTLPLLSSNKASSPQTNNNLTEESIQHVNYLKGLSKNYRTMPCK